MLIKARVSAGEREPGPRLLDFVEPLIYRRSLDFRAVEAVSETRQRISEKMAAKRGSAQSGLDIKLMPGGIRDIEFLVQCLQRLHGGREQWVRHGGTMIALLRLRDKGLLSDAEYARLGRRLSVSAQSGAPAANGRGPADAHAAVRPRSSSKCWRARCRPMAPAQSLWPNGSAQRLDEHRADVREIYERVIHAQKPLYYSDVPAAASVVEEVEAVAPASNLTRFLDRARARNWRRPWPPPDCIAAASASSIFWKRRSPLPMCLARLDGNPKLSAQVLDIFEHSPHFADDLLRYPDLLEEIGQPFELGEVPLADGGELRRFYRRQMLRIQTESILDAAPIFSTLSKTSLLADCVIAEAYRIALAEGPRSVELVLRAGKSDADHRPRPLGDERIRSGLGCRPRLRNSRCRCRRACLLDGRRRAHDPDPQRLYGRWRDVHGGHAPAPEWPRRRSGADRRRVQNVFRQPCGGLGRHHVHEIARGGGQHRARHRPSCRNCRRWIGVDMAKACAPARSWPRCAPGWNGSRDHAIR